MLKHPELWVGKASSGSASRQGGSQTASLALSPGRGSVGRECPGQTPPSVFEMGVWACCWGSPPVTGIQRQMPRRSRQHACAVVTWAALRRRSPGTSPGSRSPTVRSRRCPRGSRSNCGFGLPALAAVRRSADEPAGGSSEPRPPAGLKEGPAPQVPGATPEMEGRGQVTQERVGSPRVGSGSASCGFSQEDQGEPRCLEGGTCRGGGDRTPPSVGDHTGMWTSHAALQS